MLPLHTLRGGALAATTARRAVVASTTVPYSARQVCTPPVLRQLRHGSAGGLGSRAWSATTRLRATEAPRAQQTSTPAKPAEHLAIDRHAAPAFPRRSMLYVPGSSDKMIKKSQQSEADCVIFDLEDSVAAHRKGAARESVLHGLNAAPRPGPELAVRINPPSGAHDLASDDLDVILPSRALNTIVIPKVESLDDVSFLLERVKYHRCHSEDGAHASDYPSLSLVLSVESAQSLLRMPSILDNFASAQKRIGLAPGTVHIGALLFASEDYCASTGIVRTRSRKELLFPRASMATIAKAYDVQAIDMVCIDYKDVENLIDEATEARHMGYDGKQAIHPNQVENIQKTFTPGEAEIERAARIKAAYENAVSQNNAGAVGFAEKGGNSIIMIDAPMLKQADAILAKARAAGATIPVIDGAAVAASGSSNRSNAASSSQPSTPSSAKQTDGGASAASSRA